MVEEEIKESRREKRKKWDKKYIETHKDERREYSKRYYKENKEKIKERRKEKEYDKKYYETHRTECNERKRKYRKEHKNEYNEYMKNYKDRHPDFVLKQRYDRNNYSKYISFENYQKLWNYLHEKYPTVLRSIMVKLGRGVINEKEAMWLVFSSNS